ncbi:hypothetical protein TR13x_08125 [Caloranaerobacter sp. TR13]|uniref:DUF5685 family protein n=1 Tax=Caloranaerobacter sp. TR13 TaxID=1302151 RepID=UPI0006D44DE6|nr:DUF5685 family protein [Caloranaerobacter sp. TR13]KPU26863.1 hypothetical protein TR13x_08125 [Caloranaerobacter sp. TR13]
MFGYVTPYKDELKVREYNIFKAYYCGLCKVLGSEFNQVVRFGLNYDFTFLGLLLSSLDEKKDKIKYEGCIANPFKKKPIVVKNENLSYSAYISVILVYYKLLDDWKDERNLLSLIGMIPFIFPKNKAKYVFEDKYLAVVNNLDKLAKLEKEKCDIIDESADAFGKLMEEIAASPFISDDRTIRVLRWLGYNLGRFIYVLDAFNDIEKDIKEGNYNPILLQYKYSSKEGLENFLNRVREPIEFFLTFTLDNLAKSFELLDIKYNRNIIENIVYMGTRQKMVQILKKGSCKQ